MQVCCTSKIQQNWSLHVCSKKKTVLHSIELWWTSLNKFALKYMPNHGNSQQMWLHKAYAATLEAFLRGHWLLPFSAAAVVVVAELDGFET